MEITGPFVFQADSEIVNNIYVSHPNYIIEYNDDVPKQHCIIYFSSNDLYYPNSDIAFLESIIKKNRFEWYGNRINYGHKHIFFRDIKKQWYLTGINSTINSPEKMARFIESETEGYEITMVGSSAGGFISVILGQMLNVKRIFSFNGQYEILSLVTKPSAEIQDPILYRNRFNKSLLPFYDAVNFIVNPESIYYFQSCYSKWDIEQDEHLSSKSVNKISFRTSNHGIPFLKSNLPVVLNLSETQLRRLSGRKMHPLIFSIKMVGIKQTLMGLSSIIQFGLNKIYIRTIQKWKK